MTTPNADPPAGTTPPADPPPPEAPKNAPEPKVEPPKAADLPPVPAGVPAKAAPAPVALDADAEIPETAELLQLSKKALSERLSRHSKRELKDHFGTDDVAEIKGRLAKLETFEQQEEERRRLELTEKERLEEDLRVETQKREAAETAYQRAVDSQMFAEYDGAAKTAFDQHFAADEDTREFVTHRLKSHLLSLSDDAAPKDAKSAQKLFEDWSKEFAEKHPKYAKAPEAPIETKKIALNNGSDPHRPEKGAPNGAAKTARPGQPNSMSRAEYATWKKQHGLA